MSDQKTKSKAGRVSHTLHSLVRYRWLMLGLTLGNFISVFLFDATSFESAIERSFFQCVALIAVAITPNAQV